MLARAFVGDSDVRGELGDGGSAALFHVQQHASTGVGQRLDWTAQ
jgi:hypothetical protein